MSNAIWFSRLGEALLSIPGVLLLGLAVRNFAKGSASRNWPRTQGCILRSFVLVGTSDEGESFTPQVEYEYVVEGVKYRSTRLRYGQIGSWNRKRAEGTIAPYTVGAREPVFYNPRKPAESVLIRGTGLGNLVIVLAALVFILFAYGMERHIK
ncbi:MAG: DUF3592 domain-containing protein [Bryobacteraceae bacterium]|jgi:hypothetical protein